MRHPRGGNAILPQAVLCVAIVLAVAFPTFAVADAQKHEWFGTWSMNHDGHVGTLRVAELKADCAAPVWCDMVVTYVGLVESPGR
jgi:hypothetical protein